MSITEDDHTTPAATGRSGDITFETASFDAKQIKEAGPPSPTVYKRSKETRSSVFLADRMARRAITVGGIAVIAAVLGIMVYLISQVAPLFQGGDVVAVSRYALNAPWRSSEAVFWDEYRRIAVEVSPTAELKAYHAPSGKAIEIGQLDLGGASPTAFSADPLEQRIAFGFEDGSILVGKVDFAVEVLGEDFDLSSLTELGDGEWTDFTSVYSAIPGNQIRKISVSMELEEPLHLDISDAVKALAFSVSGQGPKARRSYAVLDTAGNLSLHKITTKKNMMTGKAKVTTRSYQLPKPPAMTAPRLLMTDQGVSVLLIDSTGEMHRYNARDPEEAVLAESVRLTPPGVGVTAAAYLVGNQSLVVGGDDGSVNISFLLDRPGAGTRDNKRMVQTRMLAPHDSAVVRIVPSQRGKSFISADAAGNLWLRHATSEQVLLKLGDAAGPAGTFRAMGLAPRLDGILAVGADGAVTNWNIHVPHPETSWKTFFGKIWYEGYDSPSYTWQSSAATDDFESKLSLVPLIFGTLKATLYSMLFAVPVALMAAVFTAEFVNRRVRSTLKPMMEMMASLPSVVLGFVAALVLAPVIERWIGAVLMGIFSVPFALLAGAYAWQMLPQHLSDRYDGLPKFLLMTFSLLAGIFTAGYVGAHFETALFVGGFKQWLADSSADATPLTGLILFPLSALAVFSIGKNIGRGKFRKQLRKHTGWRAGLLDLARVSGGTLLAGLLAWMLGTILSSWGFDPRDGLVGTYVQRNTLIVGFAMGFAVIPIIYTIAEDALGAVPDHLRGASLGCGATKWQTTMWVVMPAAMSGVFSAIMIGMGRAVGETMIVVMAAGNTPVMEWNVFSGLRALSANIAVELPEAVVGGTLYRTLFLSALVLFAMTFVINTLAEIVRTRFRNRFKQL